MSFTSSAGRTHKAAVLSGALALVVAASATPAGIAAAAPTAPTAPTASTEIRVDQLGYVTNDAKYAYLLAGHALTRPVVEVIDRSGRRIGSRPATLRGRWSARYPDVYTVDLSALRRAGSYRLRLKGTNTTSVEFPVASVAQLWRPVLTKGVSFDQVQRDGSALVDGPLNRTPAHLNDRAARTYAWPTFADPESDAIAQVDLTRINTPLRDVSGGWSDAGDYLKLTHSAAYADILLYATANELGRSAPLSLQEGGPVRHRLAGQDVGRQTRRARPAGRHRLGQRGRHLPR